MSETRIDYDRLVADYETGLVSRLRGFGPAAEFLELWVPDADPARSLANLLDAAVAAGHDAMSLVLDTGDVEHDVLVERLGAYGEVTLKDADGRLHLDIAGLHAPARQEGPDLAAIRALARRTATALRERGHAVGGEAGKEAAEFPDLYRDQALAAAGSAAHEGDLGADEGRLRLQARDGGISLALLVSPSDHRIAAARFSGAATPEKRGMMERFCALIEGLPLQEASDHGAIRLEAALRETGGHRPVPGIVTPRAAARAFAVPEALVRQALASYRTQTGYAGTVNEYDPAPTDTWSAADDAERRKRLKEAFAAMGYGEDQVMVTAIEFDVRVVVHLGGALARGDRRHHMMTLEAGLQERIDSRLELFLEELKDSNVIRRLADTGERT